MKVALSWLKKYVPVSLPAKEMAQRLTMAGIEVDGINVIGGAWDDVFVGLVTEVQPHPNADRLSLTTVDIGSQSITVVCGAPNVAPGQRVAFARVGARLLDPRSGRLETLKAARIRGVVSQGMVCSERELGLGEDHTGILVLNDDAPIGTPLGEYLSDAILELDVTPNRPDCLSVLGVAHEVAALSGSTVREPDIGYAEEGEAIEDLVRIQIADPDLCYRYTASLITGVKVGPSPRWMQELLLKAGQRPINNVVDITNYVMLEYGQPLHAFDYEAVGDRTIIVRRARPGEVLETLDGIQRTLEPPILVIADATEAVALAGVMGGANSEMTESTSAVLLESANFDPANTRRTASALKLRSEASLRFEKGLRPELAPIALRRATQLILELAGGKAAKGIVDVYPHRRERPPMKISLERVKKVLGIDLTLKEVQGTLSSLGFERAQEPEGIIDMIEAVEARPARQRESVLWVNVPYWRSDIAIEDDLVEEVARIVGYDRIPTTMMSTPIPHHQPQPVRELREDVREIMAACGMQEVITYSLTNLAALEKVEASCQGLEPIRVANPLSSDQEYLRTTLRASLLDTLAANRHQQEEEGIRLFEVGRIYLPREKDLPEEREVLAGVLSGPRFPTSWLAGGDDLGFFDARGVLETLFARLGINATYEPASDPILHPGRSARVGVGSNVLGVAGELLPRVLERFDIEGPSVALFEIDLEALYRALPEARRRYQAFSRFPGSIRDMALVVDESTPSGQIQRIVERHSLVARCKVFDVYTGENVPAGKKSLAFRILFQSPSGTLTAEQVNIAQKEILRSLRQETGAKLRGTGRP